MSHLFLFLMAYYILLIQIMYFNGIKRKGDTLVLSPPTQSINLTPTLTITCILHQLWWEVGIKLTFSWVFPPQKVLYYGLRMYSRFLTWTCYKTHPILILFPNKAKFVSVAFCDHFAQRTPVKILDEVCDCSKNMPATWALQEHPLRSPPPQTCSSAALPLCEDDIQAIVTSRG